jgi:hypothetical protein
MKQVSVSLNEAGALFELAFFSKLLFIIFLFFFFSVDYNELERESFESEKISIYLIEKEIISFESISGIPFRKCFLFL